jgi:HEAT repeats
MAAASNGRGLNLCGAVSNGRLHRDPAALANEPISIAHVIREAFGAQVDRQILVWKSGRQRCLRLTGRLVCSSCRMCDQQLDLFSSSGIRAERPLPQSVELCPTATALDDQALIAAIPEANLADSIALAAEAGRRRLAAAIPSLETLCRRFSGFGIDRMVPEQAAALQALAVIRGREAAQAVSRLIVRGVVQRPALNLAVSTAARIGSTLPADVLRFLLRHPDPGIRASVCGCARRRPELISVMIDLLEDLNQGVARSAACALGQIGRIEARPMLAKLLRDEPSEEVIDAVSSVANEECIVQLGRPNPPCPTRRSTR